MVAISDLGKFAMIALTVLQHTYIHVPNLNEIGHLDILNCFNMPAWEHSIIVQACFHDNS